jgi:uncharacterized tellurite resistance protein B-like protein
MNYQENSEENIIKLLMLMSNADNNFHENEKKTIKNKISNFGLNAELFDEMLPQVTLLDKNNFKSSCIETLKLIKDENLRNTTLKLLSSLAAEDFMIHEEEMMLLQLIADEWKMYRTSLVNK